jgi:hypothetical protein
MFLSIPLNQLLQKRSYNELHTGIFLSSTVSSSFRVSTFVAGKLSNLTFIAGNNSFRISDGHTWLPSADRIRAPAHNSGT